MMISKNRRENFCSNLKTLFEQKNLSLHTVARKSGVNKSSLHGYLNGVTPQGLVALIKIAKFFSLSLEDLIFEKNQCEELQERELLETSKIYQNYNIKLTIIKENS